MRNLLRILSSVFTILIISASITEAQCPDYYVIDGLVDTSWSIYQQNRFGESVSGAGDVDNDGINDYIIGAPGLANGDGAAFVFSGATGDTIYAIKGDSINIAEFGRVVSDLGDINNDNHDEFMVATKFIVTVYSGIDGSILFTYDGQTAAAAGDYNNDGTPDYIIGNKNYDQVNGETTYLKAGRVDVISGLNGDTLYSIVGTESYHFVGHAVDGAGDFNADGYDDVIIGIIGNNLDRGKIIVISGYDNSQLYGRNGDNPGNELGTTVAGAGDLNGDGFDDILAGYSGSGMTGGSRVFAYSGSDLNSNSIIIYSMDNGDQTAPNYGLAFDGIGDINKDGRDDFMIGDWAYASNRGRIFIHSGFTGIAFDTLIGDITTKFGYAISAIGDIDNDGESEIIVGAPMTHVPDNSQLSTGRAHLLNCVFPDTECLNDFDTDSDGRGDICDNCIWVSNPNQDDADRDGIGDACVSSRHINSTGDDIIVFISTVSGTAAITFEHIETGGDIEIINSPDGPPMSNEYQLVPLDPPKFYNITTTIDYTGLITIRLNYQTDDVEPGMKHLVSMMHYDGSQWQDITIVRDTAHNLVYGQTYTLSPFVLAGRESCCIGIRGNVDNIGGEPGIDISDILFMVEWMFRLPGDAPEPPCLEEAEINGEEPTDISDLLYMVEYMFRPPGEAPPPVICP